MVLTFAPYGSLDNLITKPEQERPKEWEQLQHRFALEMAKGMQYLHEQGIVHQDFKGQNVLV